MNYLSISVSLQLVNAPKMDTGGNYVDELVQMLYENSHTEILLER